MSSKSILAPAVSHEDTQPRSVLEELKMPFSRALIGNFFQDQPRLGNQFLEDSILRGYLKRHLPPLVGTMCCLCCSGVFFPNALHHMLHTSN